MLPSPLMNVDVSDLVKISAGLVSFGGGFAFAKPFAEKTFGFWLGRAEARAAIVDAREGAIGRIAVQHERTVGVLEAVDARLDRIDARLDRIEAHHGITPPQSAIPAPATATEAPRRALTDPNLQAPRVSPPPSTPSTPAAATG